MICSVSGRTIAFMKPVGCERCGGVGYRGRCGVFEMLELKDEVYELVRPDADGRAIDLAARRAGMTTMVEDAVAKCRAGITSAAEVLRSRPCAEP